MALDPCIADLFTESVTVNTLSSTDVYGRDSVTASSTHNARIVDREMTQYSRTGEVVRYEGVVWIAPDSNGDLPSIVPGQTTVTLPDGKEQRILAYQKFDDPAAMLDHVKLFYGVSGSL